MEVKKKQNNGLDIFETLFHEYYSPLCNYALRIVNDYFVAEEIVQNLFVEFWEKQKLAEIENVERYLLRSVKFKCFDYFRGKKPAIVQIPENIESGGNDIEGISESEVEPLLHYFAAKLPPKTREVFLLSRKSGLTYKEIANELNISVKTVENQMGRALRIMKVLLKENHFLSLLFL
jgi:RNA polymerase sigma-70 factor (ECF subfamily)